MTTDEKIQKTYNHVEHFIGDCMSAYTEEGDIDYDSEEYNEIFEEEVWTLAIDFVNNNGWDTVIAEMTRDLF
jgi:hypothetical protein